MIGYMKFFNEFVKKYNLKDKNIMGKFHHSYRVMEYCSQIAESLGLNDKDIELAKICGLYHDIARFEQWTHYNTFIDSLSFDHGTRGYEILKEMENINDIVLKATFNHNKYMVQSDLTQKEKLFCDIVRDADKIDIMIEQCLSIDEDKIIINPKVLDDFYKKEMISNDDVITSSDNIIRSLAWIFDFNFNKTYEIILEKDIFNKKLEILSIYGDNEDVIKIKEFVNKYLEEKVIKC